MAATPASAQKFPSKPIHVILPFAVGGLLDATVRAIGQSLSQSVGQPVLVENKPGGGTFIGMEACAKAAPDGYTICVTTPDSLVYNPYLYTQVPYDAEKDFVSVTNLVFTNNVIVAAGSAPFNTFKEMIAYAKANPGKVTWATWGAGSIRMSISKPYPCVQRRHPAGPLQGRRPSVSRCPEWRGASHLWRAGLLDGADQGG